MHDRSSLAENDTYQLRFGNLDKLPRSIALFLPQNLGRPTGRSENLKFYPRTFFFFFINPPRSAATQWMAIKCILEVRS